MASNHNDGSVIITGAAGGIGQALVRSFTEAGYDVIATDRRTAPDGLLCRHFVQADLQRTVLDSDYAETVFLQIREHIDNRPLKALVNNAAVQILGATDDLSRKDWSTTLDVNLLAPFFWAQAFLPELEADHGTVLNISSIHARLTKPNFVAYATSKAALSGMTRAMAVELGARIRVNAIEPAAIDTPMLRAGFEGNELGYERLSQSHPTANIGKPEELAFLARMIVESNISFLNGAVINLSGGVQGRLHDPA